MFLHAERRGAGPPLVLVHGFTQTRPLLGTRGRRARRRPRGRARRRARPRAVGRGHGRPPHRRPPHRRPGRRGHLPRLLDGRPVLPPRRPRRNPELVRGLVLLGGHRRHRGPRRARAAAPAGPATADRIERDGLEAFLDDWLAQPLFAGAPAGARVPCRAAREHRRRASGRASSRPAPARRTRRGTSSIASTCRSSSWPARTTPSSRPWPSAWPPRSATTPPLALVEGAGHAAHLEQPEALPRHRPTLARARPEASQASVAMTRRGAGGRGQALSQRPAGEEGAADELDPAGGAEDGDERGAGGALEHLEHRLAGEHDADEGGGGGGAAEAAGHDRDAGERHDEHARRRASGCGRRRCARRGCACPTRCRRGCRGGC